MLVPALVAVAIVGEVEYGLFTDDQDAGLVERLISIVFLLGVFAAPFLPIPLALLDGLVGSISAVVAFVVGIAALVGVPWLVGKSIEGDESSTAALIHMWDPVLITLAVGLVILVGWGGRRRSIPPS